MDDRTRRAYWGPTAFGVPLLKEDREKAIDGLSEYLAKDSDYVDACRLVIGYNENVVARCGSY